MNESGRSVGAAARFFKLDPDAVLVVHDEGDFDLGRVELQAGGGLAGHNGLRSIAQHLGDPGLPAPAHRRRPPGARRSRARSPTTCSRDFEPHDDAEALSRAPPTRSRRSTPRASKRAAGRGQPPLAGRSR